MNTKTRFLMVFGAAALGLGLLTGAPQTADAFCGFYVAGADAQLSNGATMVVMMRDGKRTVLSMQNEYQGPVSDFALVVPVPVVLNEDNVKTLPKAVFDRVDKLSAPRLVEYWEQDPCDPWADDDMPQRRKASGAMPTSAVEEEPEEDYGVTIEAEFTVAEYDIVILSASDSTGLDSWLHANDYKIPAGAEPLLRPYVEAGMKFFVAKVDASKVEFARRPDGSKRALLSPLRFHYDSDQFALPIRLGLINAPNNQGRGEGEQAGAQDLLVHVLARGKRYQVANYPNVPIPTNFEVKDAVRDRFAHFYVSLFDHTLAQNPKAVVTEYAWSASTCDPCPEPALTLAELVTLGADVLPAYAGKLDGKQIDSDLEWTVPSEFVLTRLHARYDASSLGEDLIFEEAPAIAGGREFMQTDGQLERGSQPASENQFQARYIIRHPWTGAVACADPQPGIWGGPPTNPNAKPQPQVARELAGVDRRASLGSFVTKESQALLGVTATALDGSGVSGSWGEQVGVQPEPEGVQKSDDPTATPAAADTPKTATPDAEKAEKAGCRCALGDSPAGGFGFGLLALLTLASVRRRDQV